MGTIILSATTASTNLLLKSYEYRHRKGGKIRVYCVCINTNQKQHKQYATTDGKEALLVYNGYRRILRSADPRGLIPIKQYQSC